MALPASDAFTGANNDPISANWTILNGSFKIWSNRAHGTTAGQDNVAMWNADTFADDQYAQVSVTNISGYISAALVRMAATRGYKAQVDSATSMTLRRMDGAGNSTVLQTISSLTISNGDVTRAEAQGSTLRMYQNGTQRGTDHTDATYASGAGGMSAFNAEALAVDDFEAGNLGGGGGGARPFITTIGAMRIGVRR